MASSALENLSAAGTVAGTDLIPIKQAGATLLKGTVNQLATGILSGDAVASGGTANGVLYLNGSKVATSGSALAFDGTNLGLGVTPSAWGAAYKVQQFANGGALSSSIDPAFTMSLNTFITSSGYKYIANGVATRYDQYNGAHQWLTAPSGTAGNPISFTQAMTLDASGNLVVGRTSALTQITFNGGDGVTYQRSTDNQFSGVLDYLKSRGSAASPTAVQNGDGLFSLRVAPYHGSAYSYLNSQAIEVDGTFTSGQNPPTRIVWYTNAANGSSTECTRLDSSGNLIQKVNGTAPTLSTNSTMSFELTSNTSLKIVVRGSDGTTRSASLTLA